MMYHNELGKIMQTIKWQLFECNQRMNSKNKHAIHLSKVIKLNFIWSQVQF